MSTFFIRKHFTFFNMTTSCFWGKTHNTIYGSVSFPAKEHNVAGKYKYLLWVLFLMSKGPVVLLARPKKSNSWHLASPSGPYLHWTQGCAIKPGGFVHSKPCSSITTNQGPNLQKVGQSSAVVSTIGRILYTFSKTGALANMDLMKTLFPNTLFFLKLKTPDCHWELALVWVTGLINVDHTIAARSTCAITKYMLCNEISKNHSYL